MLLILSVKYLANAFGMLATVELSGRVGGIGGLSSLLAV
jgi:hypothetical protein